MRLAEASLNSIWQARGCEAVDMYLSSPVCGVSWVGVGTYLWLVNKTQDSNAGIFLYPRDKFGNLSQSSKSKFYDMIPTIAKDRP